MTEIVNLNNTAATAALQVVIELIRAGDLKIGGSGEEAASIIATHTQLTEHFKAARGSAGGSIPVTR
ncbi:hypothetical protein ACCM60_14185 [Pseudomonas chlororaphis subsp. aureofaciens]|uniref:hypothetical protein n=1 Tax=Pseudomonas chlororaphis TaxID=587753 RepID=UPI00355682DE